MSTDDPSSAPPFSSDLLSLVWPMSAEEFVSSAMHTKVLFRRGDPQRLVLLEDPLGSYDLRYLFAHGLEATIWKDGGRLTTRGTDSVRDVEMLVSVVQLRSMAGTLEFSDRQLATVVQLCRDAWQA